MPVQEPEDGAQAVRVSYRPLDCPFAWASMSAASGACRSSANLRQRSRHLGPEGSTPTPSPRSQPRRSTSADAVRRRSRTPSPRRRRVRRSPRVPRLIYTAVAAGRKEQFFRTSSHYAAGSTLPLGPGTWTVERVEDTGLARWPEVGNVEEPEVRSFRLHCVVS